MKSSVDTFSFSQSHPNGTSQFPFLVNRHCLNYHHPMVCFEEGNPNDGVLEESFALGESTGSPDNNGVMEENPFLP
jgi:hypothetical protein